MAPATQDSSTSLIEQLSALPTIFTSSSGSGSFQATRFLPIGLPLSRVGESSGISASAATSLNDLVAVARHVQRAEQLLRLRQHLHRLDHAPAVHADGLDGHVGERLDHRIGQPVAFVRVVGAAPLAPRRIDAAIGDRHHHRDQRDAVADAVVDAHDQRAAALVVLDQVELPQRMRRVERRAWPVRRTRLQRGALALAALARAASRAPRGGRCRSPRRRTQLRADRVLHHLLAEAVVLEQLVLDALAQRRRSRSPGCSSQTPTIIIRLTSLSMRSHAVSTRDMRSAASTASGLSSVGRVRRRARPRCWVTSPCLVNFHPEFHAQESTTMADLKAAVRASRCRTRRACPRSPTT